jgi:hypothetical protein
MSFIDGSISQWLPLRQAADALGVSISTLYRMRRDGLLLSGNHWHRGLGRRSPVQMNVTASRLALQVFCSR